MSPSPLSSFKSCTEPSSGKAAKYSREPRTSSEMMLPFAMFICCRGEIGLTVVTTGFCLLTKNAISFSRASSLVRESTSWMESCEERRRTSRTASEIANKLILLMLACLIMMPPFIRRSTLRNPVCLGSILSKIFLINSGVNLASVSKRWSCWQNNRSVARSMVYDVTTPSAPLPPLLPWAARGRNRRSNAVSIASCGMYGEPRWLRTKLSTSTNFLMKSTTSASA
mmetsp:Transcript_14577/g.40037  ORF Transcript_14577/g.40037 Transcript_14577/m.40037 type:complete len:226 (-) Transcript_14577:978-1655(-)